MSCASIDLDQAADALAEWLTAGGKLPPDTALRLRSCGLPDAIDSALDHAPGPGKRLPETKALLARRDNLLREVGKFYPGSTRERAKAICSDWTNYAANAWERDRKSETCPERHRGTKYAIYFALLAAHLPVRRPDLIRRVLGRQPQLTLPHESDDGESVKT